MKKEMVTPKTIKHTPDTAREVNKDKWFHKKNFIKNFLESFDKYELIIYSGITLVISIILTTIITVNNGNYKLLKDIIELLISYFSISIGFSFTALIFIIQSFKNVQEKNEIINKIASLITFYIIHGLLIITLSLIEVSMGSLFKLYGTFYMISNYVTILFFMFMILFNIYIFFKIIKLVYHFSLSNLYK